MTAFRGAEAKAVRQMVIVDMLKQLREYKNNRAVWVSDDEKWSCSKCGYVRAEGEKPTARYCEHCGAEMGEENE